MPDRKVSIYTEDGERVTCLAVYPVRKHAPFRNWSIVRCMEKDQIENYVLPKGVEAEIVLLLMLRAHEATRTSEIARMLDREVATVCRALRRLEERKWVKNIDRGQWIITSELVHYGRWKRGTKNAR